MTSVANALRRAIFAGATAVLISSTVAAPASAQDFFSFLWGGDESHGGERKKVTFSPKYDAGQVIVSFGDRRLYWVYRKGAAISYPIAVPREQSRWEGKTSVSMKRENPSYSALTSESAGICGCGADPWPA